MSRLMLVIFLNTAVHGATQIGVYNWGEVYPTRLPRALKKLLLLAAGSSVLLCPPGRRSTITPAEHA
jgi:hypothetical protein